MEYRVLGKSTLLISEIGFGCMSLGVEDAANARLLHHALDAGINYFDTADLYNHGQNEITVGKALQSKRKEVIIATKVGNQWRGDGSGWDWNPTKNYILTAVNESLKRLQTDYIDLYQLHGGTTNDPIEEIIEAFETLQQQGKIRYYGISSIRPNVIKACVQQSNITSVMMQYSLLDRRPEETCLDLLQQQNIGVLARGGLAKGLLVNKPPTGYLNYEEAIVQKMAQGVQSISSLKRGPAQTALRFVLNNTAIACAVAGIRTAEQLDEAVKTISAPLLSQNELQELEQLIPINYYTEHR